MNPKAKGEKGQRIAIGVLAKWDIDVAIPLTDNLPFDFIVIYGDKMFRAQVKSGETCPSKAVGSTEFDLRTNNWYAKTSKKYTAKEVDVMVLCDFETIYLLTPEQFSDRCSFSVRKVPSKNGNKAASNFANDLVISDQRIVEVFGTR